MRKLEIKDVSAMPSRITYLIEITVLYNYTDDEGVKKIFIDSYAGKPIGNDPEKFIRRHFDQGLEPPYQRNMDDELTEEQKILRKLQLGF